MRALLAALLIGCAGQADIGSESAAVCTQNGDLNADGAVNALDLQLEVNVFLGTQTTPAIVARADVNCDGAVNAIDVQLLVNLILAPAGGTQVWARPFGTTGSDIGESVAVDSDGNVFMVGRFTPNDAGQVDLGGGPILVTPNQTYVFVGKYRGSDGHYLWASYFPGWAESYGVAVDGNKDVVVLATSSTQDLTKYRGTDGVQLWTKSFGGGGGQGLVIDTGANCDGSSGTNCIAVSGYLYGADFGGGPLTRVGMSDAFIAKYKSDGSYLWAKQFGGTSASAVASGIAVDTDHNLFIGGHIEGSVSFGGASPISDTHGLFLAKHRGSDGGNLWGEAFGGGSGGGSALSLAVDSDKNVVMTGYFAGTINFGNGAVTTYASCCLDDIFVGKYAGTNGAYQWLRHFGGVNAGALGYTVAIDADKNIIFGGTFGGTVDFGGGAISSYGDSGIVGKLNGADGAYKWAKAVAPVSNGNASVYGVAVDASRNVLLTGDMFASTIDLMKLTP